MKPETAGLLGALYGALAAGLLATGGWWIRRKITQKDDSHASNAARLDHLIATVNTLGEDVRTALRGLAMLREDHDELEKRHNELAVSAATFGARFNDLRDDVWRLQGGHA